MSNTGAGIWRFCSCVNKCASNFCDSFRALFGFAVNLGQDGDAGGLSELGDKERRNGDKGGFRGVVGDGLVTSTETLDLYTLSTALMSIRNGGVVGDEGAKELIVRKRRRSPR